MTSKTPMPVFRSSRLIIAGIVFNLVLLVSLTLAGLERMEHFRSEINNVLQRGNQDAERMQRLRRLVQRQGDTLKRMLTADSTQRDRQYLQHLRLGRDIDKLLQEIRQHSLGLPKSGLEALQRSITTSAALQREVRELIRSDKGEQAREQLAQRMGLEQGPIWIQFQELLERHQQAVVAAMERLSSKQRETIRLLVMTGIATLLLSLLAGLVIRRRVAAIEEEMLTEAGERRQAEIQLQQHQNQLEQQIAERTHDLQQANKALQSQIVERQFAEAILSEEKERAQVTLASIGDAVITTDEEENIENMNPAAQELTGWPLREARGRPLAQVYRVSREQEAKAADDGNEETEVHHILHRRDQRQVFIKQTISPIRSFNESVIGTVLVFHDVTRSRKLARQLSWQANHDALTGLLNRHEFERRLEQILENTRLDGGQHALFFMDLDRFKIVNDSCGHGAGDELLKQLAALIEGQLRSHDILARLGGDEFCVLLEDCPHAQAVKLAEGIREAVANYRFPCEQQRFRVGVSIGVVSIGTGAEPKEAILSAADKACYRAKKQGRNRVCSDVSSSEAMQQTPSEADWATRINEALEKARFVLYCQRAQSIAAGPRSVYLEVLLRMADSDGELLSPDAFLSTAERYDLTPRLDRWVLHETLTWMANRRSLPAGLVVAINISAQTLADAGFADTVVEALKHSGVPPHQVCFEIAENTAVANLTGMAKLHDRLQPLRCRFAVDDFGSSLSAFDYLKELSLHYLKIDGRYIRNIATDPVDHALVRSIHEIARSMGLQTIAESVDDEAVLKVLGELNLDFAQGYGVSRPVPLAKLSEFSQRMGEHQ